MTLDEYKISLIDAALRGEEIYLLMLGEQRWVEHTTLRSPSFRKESKATKRSMSHHIIRRTLTLKRAIALIEEHYKPVKDWWT